ncbi:MAG TPA: indolepyruvate oxidoreductase subunit beta family protein [Caldimonas sp.]|nr:indolepyruvate oxidoreductase subunit beta family protein [Caldimonas sp.]
MNDIAPRRSSRNEPTSVLIAALGGQGGGVLTEWIVHAAGSEGLVAQATSTPGVSQRTGATSYYVEIVAAPPLGAAPPVLGLAPLPGRVDVLVCAELLEAARMLERGMSTPSRTTVVASTHRVYTTREKMSGADGRFASERIVEAVRALSRRAILFDMEAIRARHGTIISAALFGALAGSGALPVSREACAGAIRAAGKGVQASLAAFDDAFARAQVPQHPDAGRHDAAARSDALPAPLARRVAALPRPVAAIAAIGAAELISYQDARYAGTYVDRVARIAIAEARSAAASPLQEVACEVARSLALWMRYDDLVRVAQCKARASRLARIRAEAGAQDGDIVRVHDLFRPGALEFAAILPTPIGAWLERRSIERRARSGRGTGSDAVPGHRLTLQTSSVSGALLMRVLAALRPLRTHSLRFAREQRAIADWLAAIEEALWSDCAHAALHVSRMARLHRGYGGTHAAGQTSFERILATWRAQMRVDARAAAAALRERVDAALAEPGCVPSAPARVAAPIEPLKGAAASQAHEATVAAGAR